MAAERAKRRWSYGATPPFTHPDLDDTAVALMALRPFAGTNTKPTADLLRRLQNKDGSWSTFPSFEETPPNLKSAAPVYITSTDVTVHVLEALWGQKGHESAVLHGLQWLLEQQRPSGEFPAVWFEGSVYGTAQTLNFFTRCGMAEDNESRPKAGMAEKSAFDFLLSQQNADGSWGTSVIENIFGFKFLVQLWT
jgi:squalene cyclase